MPILLIESKDNAFLNPILELIKKVKGVKARYFDSNENMADIDD